MANLSKGRSKLIVLASAVAVMTVAETASAAPIDIGALLVNPSFEANTNTIAGPLTCPTGWTCAEQNSPPGAAAFQITSAQYTPGSDGLPGNLVVPNGSNAALLPAHLSGLAPPADPLAGAGSGFLSQLVGLTYTSGTSYSFDFWIGMPNTQPDNLFPVIAFPETVKFQLLGPGNLCDQGSASLTLVGGGTTTVTGTQGGCVFSLANPGPGKWAEYQLLFNDVGVNTGTVGIQFQVSASSTNQPREVNIDIGSVTRAPEPASLSLFGGGLALLGWYRRRRAAVK